MDFRKLTDFLQLTTPYKDSSLVQPKKSDSSAENDSNTASASEPKVFVKQEPKEELFSWKTSIPPFKVPKRILRSGFVFVFLFAIFLVLAQDWVFLLMVLGMVFIINLLLKVQNQNLMFYKIYSNGFDYCGTFYSWEELSLFFYFEGTSNQIVINSKDPIPGRLYVYFKEEDREKIDELLNKYIAKSLVHDKDFFEFLIFKVKPYLNLSDEK